MQLLLWDIEKAAAFGKVKLGTAAMMGVNVQWSTTNADFLASAIAGQSAKIWDLKINTPAVDLKDTSIRDIVGPTQF